MQITYLPTYVNIQRFLNIFLFLIYFSFNLYSQTKTSVSHLTNATLFRSEVFFIFYIISKLSLVK
jgi:hypothetical protein